MKKYLDQLQLGEGIKVGYEYGVHKWDDLSIDEISRRAMLLREKNAEQSAGAGGEDAAAQP